jgi:hypothetical protein
MLRFWFGLIGSLVLSTAFAASPGFQAQFVGGTVAALSKSGTRVDLTGSEALVFHCGKTDLRISYTRINTIEYGQNVSRRYAAAILISPILLLSKSRKHFVTLGYTDEDGNQQALVFRVGKGDIRVFLAGLEARTGRRVEFQDNEARKAGKG